MEMDDLFADQTAVSLPEINRSAGLAQLDMFLSKAGSSYAKGRNFDLGPAVITWCRVCQVISDAGL